MSVKDAQFFGEAAGDNREEEGDDEDDDDSEEALPSHQLVLMDGVSDHHPLLISVFVSLKHQGKHHYPTA